MEMARAVGMGTLCFRSGLHCDDSRDATYRTFSRLSIELLVSGESGHLTFVHVHPRNMKEFAQAIIAVRNGGVLNKKRMRKFCGRHVVMVTHHITGFPPS